MKKKQGLRDIARRAGVSVMTVSRALNCKGYVAEATHRKIVELSRKHGVVPRNRGKRSPRYARSTPPDMRNVNVIFNVAFSTTFLAELVVSIQRTLANHHYACVFRSYSGEHADFLRILGGIRPPECPACLAVGEFSGNEAAGLLAANPMTVFVDYAPPAAAHQPLNIVDFDNLAAVKLAAAQLAQCGCRRCVCLQGPPDHHFSRSMREGFLNALGQTEFGPGQLISGAFSPAGGYEAVRRALAEGKPIDGLFTTDEMAFGAFRALREAGRRIPEDVKVMGCDGIELGQELAPPLSTVILDRRLLGNRAVQRLMELIHAKSPPGPETILLPPRLELRGSCRPAGAKQQQAKP